MGAARYNKSLLQLPEVKSLVSVYLSALQSLTLSSSLSPCKAVSLRRHVSFNGVHTHMERWGERKREGGKASREEDDKEGRPEKLIPIAPKSTQSIH